MLIRRKTNSLGSEGRAGIGGMNGGNTNTTIVRKPITVKRTIPIKPSSGCLSSTRHTSISCMPSNSRIVVQRVQLFSADGGVAAICQKKFQRPCLKRRAYGTQADVALKQSSLGQKRRFGSMDKILARAGRPLMFKLPEASKNNDDECDSDDDEDSSNEPERPFEPLEVWQSPHMGGRLKGLPPQMVREMRPDEFGIEEEVTVLKPAPVHLYSKNSVLVPPLAAKWLRPHQREGVKFMYECVMGLRDFRGNGCILADDMGLGKTLQSVSLIYTLLKSGITADGVPSAKRVIVVCPCSLVKNWEHEFIKWFGVDAVKTEALADQSRKDVERAIDSFCKTKIKNVLIASYECIRTHADRLRKHKECCDLLVCDEAHRLKNSDNQTSKALNSLPVKRRVLLTGTPMQNDLQEFYAMVDFTNPNILGTPEEFRRKVLFPILRGREPDASDSQKKKMMEIQNDMSTTVNDFILRRINTLNAQHLPPKLVQVVCCNLTEIQKNMYQHLISSKDTQHLLDGKQTNCLAAIQLMMKLSNHPSLVVEDDRVFGKSAAMTNNRRSTAKVIKYNDEPESQAVPGADGISRFLPCGIGGDGVHPEWSGKMFVLYRLMKEMRRPGNGSDKIVIISNYTQTLDLIGRMCKENNWGFCRLDGSVTMKKRQRMVEDFNDPGSSLIAFLLSSKAGGCGLNLIGGNRLVLFDPDWNPAVDKQAAARCWRDGQKKRCFTYRFLATGTVEEKIFQRQLSKEGLQSVVDDKEQVNALSTKDLRNLFKLRHGTPSDTHDKLQCERCKIIHDNAEMEAAKVMPRKLAKCQNILEEIIGFEDSKFFIKELDPTVHGISKEAYENLVKQPMDFETIKKKLAYPVEHSLAYKNITGFSKDVNRIFGNVMKVWSPGDEIADAARRLQAVWMEKWTCLVPVLMTLKTTDEDDLNCGEKTGQETDDLDEVLKNCATMNNERSDDYQEQIGMPDEENMRHWSHHYSTDTVDDPVFRAALRGTDSVSFVFGLEVTWSLIQQRQQDEEERMAMEALEHIQEVDDENAVDVDDQNDSKPPAKELPLNDEDMCSVASKEGDVGEASQDEEHVSDDEPMIQDDSDDGNSSSAKPRGAAITETFNDENFGACNDSITSEEDDDLVLDSLGKRGITECDDESKASNNTRVVGADITNSMVGNATRRLPVDKTCESNGKRFSLEEEHNFEGPPPSTQSGSTNDWTCFSCTFINKVSSKKCTICGTRKPRLSTTPTPKKRRG